MVKVCNKCNIEKELKEFDYRNDTKNYRPYCIECRKKRDLQYSIKTGKNKGIYSHNRKLQSEGLKHCKRCNTTQSRNNFHNSKYKPNGKCSHCKKCSSEKNKEYRKINIEKRKEYYKHNRERIIRQTKKYKVDNKELINKYYREKIKTDPLFKLKCNLRNRTTMAFKRKGYSKNTKTQEMLGVDWKIAKQHIERQFTKGMNWNNYGNWHIDHIIPLASAKTPERLKQLCHYTNLQPLWAEENLSKNDKIIGQQTLLRI
jgi:hypothetical protein